MKSISSILCIGTCVTMIAGAGASATPAAASSTLRGVDPAVYLRLRNQQPTVARELMTLDASVSVAILTHGPDGFLVGEERYPDDIKAEDRHVLRAAERQALLMGAMIVLVNRKHPEAATLIHAQLGSADARVRAEAAQRLGETHSNDAVPVLVRVATDDRDSAVRCAALAGLGQHRSDAAFEALVPFAQRPRDDAERVATRRALAALGSTWAWQARGDASGGAAMRARVDALLASLQDKQRP